MQAAAGEPTRELAATASPPPSVSLTTTGGAVAATQPAAEAGNAADEEEEEEEGEEEGEGEGEEEEAGGGGEAAGFAARVYQLELLELAKAKNVSPDGVGGEGRRQAGVGLLVKGLGGGWRLELARPRM